MSQNNRPLNVALIGVGMVAKTHLRAVRDLAPLVQVRGVLARSLTKARDFAAMAEKDEGVAGIHAYGDLPELLADTALDFVILLTPPNARQSIVEALCGAGLPLLMEKPVERDLARARALVETCEAAGNPLGIVFQHRFRAVSEQLADLLSAGALGTVGLVEATVPWWREQGYYDEPGRGTYDRDGGGVLISQAIHTLDLMLSLVGDVERVQAIARKTRFHSMEAEDFVSAGLTFANGAVGSLQASTAQYPGGAEFIVIHGDQGVARLGAGQLVLQGRDGREDVFGDQGTTGGGADPMAFTHAWHQCVIEDFAHAVQKNRPPRVTGREALRVHALIDALIASSDQERALDVQRDVD
ncbi:MAG: gfo/Idh/MocA family oxidoreductase [Alphaproteobacteria bacterium TMED89]|nr:oxidoreductase [Rhodospirillaceae bacterium]RPH19752.1 MAG: gfo/Idh/MocA family oxidoreductase [Alphaproteobacteria bacterium TMED89]